MKTSSLPIACLLLASAFSSLAVSIAHSQAADSPPKPAPYLLNLFPPLYPLYPPLARQARIAGDVVLQIGVRPDGSVASAEVISGQAMLKQAALDSARKSTYECRGCSADVDFYRLTYTFGIREDVECSVRRARSANCLYLWRCGGWREATHRAPAVAQRRGHVTILVDAACLEPETAR